MLLVHQNPPPRHQVPSLRVDLHQGLALAGWALNLLSLRPLLFLLLLLSPLPFLSLPPSPTLLGITMASQPAEIRGEIHPPLPTRPPQSPRSRLPELAAPQSSPTPPSCSGRPNCAEGQESGPLNTFRDHEHVPPLLSLSLSSCTMGRLLPRPDMTSA